MGNTRNPGRYNNKVTGDFQRVDRLYRNDYNASLGHPVFTEVSQKSGIVHPGFSLGVNINDINRDGYKDIYITNDFLSDDLLYVNNGDGTFTDQSRTYLKHSSYSAMGNDVIDINNDGYDDIIALDMFPEDNYRQKRLLGPTNYTFYLNNEKFNYSYQFARNTLQLNPGIAGKQDTFSFQDIGSMAGMSATDWSWTPLVADFDHDGYRDLIITNGFPKDVTDRDYTDYRADAFAFASKEILLSKIPSVKLPNYAYKNKDGYHFEDVTEDWGLEVPTFSNGAAYGDLDNDGDLDIIINNINDPLSIYKNNANERNLGNYIQIELTGVDNNLDALGSRVEVLYGDEHASYEYSPYRGYLSTHDKRVHIGLGAVDTIDHIRITWPDGMITTLSDVSAINQLMTIDYDGAQKASAPTEDAAASAIFSSDQSLKASHLEWDYIDYNVQALLPHKLSQLGPGLSAADINGDGLDDLYVPGSAYVSEQVYYQTAEGQFRQDSLIAGNNDREEQVALFIDFDGDKDLDLYLTAGSYEFDRDNPLHKDLIYENNSGTFIPVDIEMPTIFSASVAAADYDRDGDIDVFVGGRAVPTNYPEATDSYLLDNHSSAGAISFKLSDQSDQFSKLGNVSDVLWTDINGDGWQDLMVVGEFMDIQAYINNQGTLKKMDIGLSDYLGFWNSISPVDIDSDGDTDYVVGNRGGNLFNKVNDQTPYRVYMKDFDDNDDVDMIPSAYFLSGEDQYIEYPTVSRMDLAKEINQTRKMYPSYDAYGRLTLDELITPETQQESQVFEVNYQQHVLLINDNGAFTIKPLPIEAQIAPIYGIQSGDFDDDGHVDLLLVGNDYGNELIQGRLDAFNGLMLRGTGTSELKPVTVGESGFYVPQDAKALIALQTPDGLSYVVGQNKGEIKKFDRSIRPSKIVSLNSDDCKVVYSMNNRTRVEEHNYGSSYLGQSSRAIAIPANATSVTITNFKGESRTITP
jgi:hypothetical protein